MVTAAKTFPSIQIPNLSFTFCKYKVQYSINLHQLLNHLENCWEIVINALQKLTGLLLLCCVVSSRYRGGKASFGRPGTTNMRLLLVVWRRPHLLYSWSVSLAKSHNNIAFVYLLAISLLNSQLAHHPSLGRAPGIPAVFPHTSKFLAALMLTLFKILFPPICSTQSCEASHLWSQHHLSSAIRDADFREALSYAHAKCDIVSSATM